jgi:hypothetical protein
MHTLYLQIFLGVKVNDKYLVDEKGQKRTKDYVFAYQLAF